MSGGRNPSVVIIGGGVAGLATAWRLTQLGVRDVTVLEREHLASGSSGVTIGNVPGLRQDPLDTQLRAMSLKVFEELEADIGMRWTGNIRMSLDPGNEGLFRTTAEQQRELGIDARVIDADEVQRLVPDMRCDDIATAIHIPHSGPVDGHLLCEAFASRAKDGGAVIRTRTEVLGLGKDAEGRHLLSTTTGSVACEVIVNAAGAWSQHVGNLLGVATPVVPRRHEVFIVHTDKTIDYPMPQVGEAFAMRSAVSGSGLYFQQEGPRSMLAGIHTGGIDDAPGDDPNTYERAVQEAGELQIAQALLDRLPGMGEMGLRGGWAGLYPNSPDARPLVGPCNDDGTIVAACGLGGWGVQVSPMIGQLAAEWVAFGELRTTPSAAEFVPMRFVAA